MIRVIEIITVSERSHLMEDVLFHHAENNIQAGDPKMEFYCGGLDAGFLRVW